MKTVISTILLVFGLALSSHISAQIPTQEKLPDDYKGYFIAQNRNEAMISLDIPENTKWRAEIFQLKDTGKVTLFNVFAEHDNPALDLRKLPKGEYFVRFSELNGLVFFGKRT